MAHTNISIRSALFSTLIAFILFFVASMALFVMIFNPFNTVASSTIIESFEQPRPYTVFGGDWQRLDGALQQQQLENDRILLFPDLTSFQLIAPYYISTQFEVNKGDYGVGMLFNIESSSKIANGHMVRFLSTDAGKTILYGYYDREGQFFGQAQSDVINLDLQANIPATLTIAIDRYTFDVFVNETRVVEDAPLLYQTGHIGLMTAFSDVDFEQLTLARGTPSTEVLRPLPPVQIIEAPTNEPAIVEVTPNLTTPVIADNTPIPREIRYILNDATKNLWTAFNGDWLVTSERIMHETLITEDVAIYYTDLVPESFTYSVQITHDDVIGGGVLFNAPNTQTIEDASMVRIFETGQLIYGTFMPEGFSALGTASITDANSVKLTIEKIGAQYAIRIDDVVIATDIPVSNSSLGYVGVLTFNANPSFSNITLQFQE